MRPDMDQNAALERLLAPGTLRILFHPIYEITVGRGTDVWAVEALVRGPEGSDLEQAGHLLDFARRHRAEPAIDRACVETALTEVATLPAAPSIALNVHASTLGHDIEFVPFLVDAATRHGVSPERVIVEVVQQVPTWHEATYRRNMELLRSRGFRLALDDIGVGHANLRFLLDTRPHLFKIDGTIVRGCHADYYRWALVEWAHMLATRLGSWSLAEGIEDQADLAAVMACGISLVQGFVFCQPMPANELAHVDLIGRARLVLSDLAVEAA